MIAKMVLPLLGGAPAVWNTCMVFFQACLLIGYAYAHLSISKLGVRRQAILHVAIVAAALAFLPLRLPISLAPPATGNPSLWLLAVLARTIAVPFVVLSSTAPLAQKWFAHAARGADEGPPPDPYFLYAASNVGSMLALLSYPILVEPRMDLGRQTRTWTHGYWALLALIL